MDKKLFFESLVSLLPDNSGHEIQATGIIGEVFSTIKMGLSDTKLQEEFTHIEKDILFRIWMLEQICNRTTTEDENTVSGPLVVISLSQEILFANKVYCTLSGLTPLQIQQYAREGSLISQIYEGESFDNAQKAVSRLQSGKGYKQLELSMKYSGRKIDWNSYGGVGGFIEIRSGREIHSENNQHSERENFYRGRLMNTSRLIEKLYQVGAHGIISKEDEQKLVWIQEFVSVFDFLWNHSEFFMEIINLPETRDREITGAYNTVYAQFFKKSFNNEKGFKNIITRAHGGTIGEFLETREHDKKFSIHTHIFHTYKKSPIAEVSWQYSTYPNERIPGYSSIFSIGTLSRKIIKKNIFVRLFQYILKKENN